MSRKILWAVIISLVMLCGCSGGKTERKKVADVDFTIVEEIEIPEELKKIIDEKKNSEFKVTYAEGEYLYISQGFGKRTGSGYCVTVDSLYLTKNAVCVAFGIIGGEKESMVEEGESFPYIVVKCENPSLPVVFQ